MMTSSLQIVDCRSASNILAVKLDHRKRYVFYLCASSSEGEDYLLTTFSKYVINSRSGIPGEYHNLTFIYDPAVSREGVNIFADGDQITEQPFYGDSSPQLLDSSVQWGTVSVFGRSSVNYRNVDFELIDGPCLQNYSRFLGCTDSRYSNYNPLATVQNAHTDCKDVDPPNISVDAAPIGIDFVAQFDNARDYLFESYDKVDGNLTASVSLVIIDQHTGEIVQTVNTSIVTEFLFQYDVSDLSWNRALTISHVLVR
jgi:hypothetical protein